MTHKTETLPPSCYVRGVELFPTKLPFPVSGWIMDVTGNPNIPLFVFAVCQTLGGAMLTLVPLVQRLSRDTQRDRKQSNIRLVEEAKKMKTRKWRRRPCALRMDDYPYQNHQSEASVALKNSKDSFTLNMNSALHILRSPLKDTFVSRSRYSLSVNTPERDLRTSSNERNIREAKTNRYCCVRMKSKTSLVMKNVKYGVDSLKNWMTIF